MWRKMNEIQLKSPFLKKFDFKTKIALTKNEMSDDTPEHEQTKKGERQDEHVKVAIVSLSNAIADPRTMMIESLWEMNGKETGRN
jgi:hypothetical protein